MNSIANLLNKINGAAIASIDTVVPVALKGGKKNEMQGRVTKRTVGSKVMMFQNKNGSAYESMIHRRLAEQLRREAAEKVAKAKALLADTLTEEQMDELVGTIDSFVEKAEHMTKAKELFKVSARAWGERIPETPVIVHTGKDGVTKHYLEVIFLGAGESTYYLDGQEIDKDSIIGLDPAEIKPESQGGLEDKVIIRTYTLSNVEEIRCGGVHKGPFTY